MFSGKHLGMSCYSIPAIVVSQQLRGGHGWSEPHSKKIHSWGELSLKTWKRVKQRIHRQEWRRAGKVHIGRCDLGCPVPWVVGTELRKTDNEDQRWTLKTKSRDGVWSGLVLSWVRRIDSWRKGHTSGSSSVAWSSSWVAELNTCYSTDSR